ncbi:MAG: hypothetical protein KOO60_07465 [Gemmatimonadales bacterium]|nr:hypothetical protein [Gemmatimonadales bacterium]
MALNMAGYTRPKREFDIGADRPLKFTELSLGDYAAFSAWVAEQRDINASRHSEKIKQLARDIEGIDPLVLLEKLCSPPTDEEIEHAETTPEGIGYLIYLSLKYAYPEISHIEAMQVVPIGMIAEVIQFIMPKKDGDPANPKKAPAKRTQARKR